MEKKTGNRGVGRTKGVPNKVTKELKEMILGALDDAGGQAYLAKQAEENPNAFLTLVGKVLPMTVNTNLQDTTPIKIHIIKAEEMDL